MSLKAFHLVFIALSVAMCLFVGAWGVNGYLQSDSGADLALGVSCFVLGFVLIVYGIRVYRKLQSLPR